ncbi:MAG: hypothetical protein ACOC46_03200, partial [Pirellulales bacterium]
MRLRLSVPRVEGCRLLFRRPGFGEFRLLVAGAAVLWCGLLFAQQPTGEGAGREPTTPGGAGGGAQADFESLIDLITSTVKPQTWEDVGGPGSIAPFPTGVAVDARGVLQRKLHADRGAELERLRR